METETAIFSQAKTITFLDPPSRRDPIKYVGSHLGLLKSYILKAERKSETEYKNWIGLETVVTFMD